MFMAVYTAEYAEIAAVGMTFIAIAPLSHVSATVNREIEFVVIVSRWFPTYDRMTGLAVGRKTGCRMGWGSCIVVIIFVTTVAICT